MPNREKASKANGVPISGPPLTLERKLELLESRFTQPNPQQQGTLQAESSSAATETAFSNHSFSFHTPSRTSNESSNLPASRVRSQSKRKPSISTSFHAVEKATTLHLEKLAATSPNLSSTTTTLLLQDNNANNQRSLSGFANSNHNNSALSGPPQDSNQTLLTSHVNVQNKSNNNRSAAANNGRVVAESPPILVSPHNNQAAAAAHANHKPTAARNLPMSTTTTTSSSTNNAVLAAQKSTASNSAQVRSSSQNLVMMMLIEESINLCLCIYLNSLTSPIHLLVIDRNESRYPNANSLRSETKLNPKPRLTTPRRNELAFTLPQPRTTLDLALPKLKRNKPAIPTRRR